MGDRGYGHDPSTLGRLAQEVQSVHASGVEQCLVIGGGNMVRGEHTPPTASSARPAITWACSRP